MNETYSRKKLKKNARGILKRHYFLLVILMLIALYLGSGEVATGNILSYNAKNTYDSSVRYVLEELMNGDLSGAYDKVNDNLLVAQNTDTRIGDIQIGHSNGILADLANKKASGSFWAAAASVIFRLVDSSSVAGLIFMLLALIVVSAVNIFVMETYNTVYSRIILESRIYKKINVSSFLFLIRTRQWIHVSMVYLYKNFKLFLWWLTIVGGVIKTYSYAMVPYIMAENPKIKAKDAIKLSCRMMKGHKWQLFVYKLSFIGWDILSGFTGRLLNIAFLSPYKAAAYTEYYVYLRKLSKDDNIEGSKLLNDEYLYQTASDEMIDNAYADIVALMDDPSISIVSKSKIGAFIQDVFGIVLWYDDKELEYRKSMANDIHVNSYRRIINKEAYPVRLCSTKTAEGRHHLENVYYYRHYSVLSLISIFFIFCLVGWIWEGSIHIIKDGHFVNRGVMHGPWIPIYGSGAVLILVTLNKLRKNPFLEFIAAVGLCGVVEYTTSYVLEIIHDGTKWWDYTGYFLNINGRVCAEGLLVFGLGGVVAVYVLAPLIDNKIMKIKKRILIPICGVLLTLFISDSIYSVSNPNVGKGVTDYETASIELNLSN